MPTILSLTLRIWLNLYLKVSSQDTEIMPTTINKSIPNIQECHHYCVAVQCGEHLSFQYF